MRNVVSNRSDVAIYEQIKSQVKEAIFSGELKDDEALPSINDDTGFNDLIPLTCFSN